MIMLSGNEFKTLLPHRSDNSHKGDFGTAGIVSGSICYQGAACLATRAALSLGAGIVCAFIPDVIYNAFASKIYGAVIEPMESKNGCIYDTTLAKKIRARKCTALLCGSGLGLESGAVRAVADVSATSLPVVFDGDALRIISQDLSLLERSAPTVITPHLGEFSRLSGGNLDASAFAKTYNCTVVLKSSETVIATADGETFCLSNPTSALSKGGSGDVLAGMLCALLAQGVDVKTASVIAVTLHNACGHDAAKKLNEYSVLAEDIVYSIRRVL